MFASSVRLKNLIDNCKNSLPPGYNGDLASAVKAVYVSMYPSAAKSLTNLVLGEDNARNAELVLSWWEAEVKNSDWGTMLGVAETASSKLDFEKAAEFLRSKVRPAPEHVNSTNTCTRSDIEKSKTGIETTRKMPPCCQCNGINRGKCVACICAKKKPPRCTNCSIADCKLRDTDGKH